MNRPIGIGDYVSAGLRVRYLPGYIGAVADVRLAKASGAHQCSGELCPNTCPECDAVTKSVCVQIVDQLLPGGRREIRGGGYRVNDDILGAPVLEGFERLGIGRPVLFGLSVGQVARAEDSADRDIGISVPT
jgi:hypothetical protein